MQCPNCSAVVREGSKFCVKCGTALPHACPSCGHGAAADDLFCAQCGTSLQASDPQTAIRQTKIAPTTSSKSTATPQAERRQITIMFCDMVGSSALSTQLDPEEQREVVSAFQSACAAEINRLDGMVAQYLGDGVLAYFGYPAAHEDDAERAVRAGLAIIDRIGTAAASVTIQARVGIASGVVVVGALVREGVTQENAAIGETTNLAARLQSIAQPNTVVIAPVTYRLVRGFFEYRDLGRHALKGFAEPFHVRQVLGLSRVESRFDAQHQSGTAPLLGRDEEIELLTRRWQQAIRGEGRVAIVSGEPGIGKSRLLRALRDILSSESHTPLSYFCAPTFQDSALYPFIGQLSRAADIERSDSNEQKLAKLEALLASSSGKSADAPMPILATLLSIPGGESYQLPDMSPQRRKERTFDVLLHLLKQLAAQQPILMVFEDLHWIDPTSLELLSLAIDQIQSQRILLIATARPEFKPSWPNHPHISTVSLSRLDRTAVRALVEGVTQRKRLPSDVLDQIVARTDGVPLFVEELTKTILESGLVREFGDRYELSGPLPPLAIPSTLHASLLARLDRFPSAKSIAQVGAAIGREFSYRLIAAVTSLPEKELHEGLTQLNAAELIFQRGSPPTATYQFKHALVQDAAYATLIRSNREQLHKSIVAALKKNFPETEHIEPQVLAKHCDQAALAAEAASYWLQAGRLAMANSSTKEARVQLEQGLQSVRRMPEGLDQRRLEFDLYAALGQVLMAIEGYASTAVGQTLGHAEKLAREMDDRPRLHRTLIGLRAYHQVSGELETAKNYGFQCIELARQLNDSTLLIQSQIHLVHSLTFIGEFTTARAYVAEAASGLEAMKSNEKAYDPIGLHPKAWSPALASWIEWHLGFPDKAANCALKAIDAARRLGRAQVIEQVLYNAAQTHLMRREPELAIKFAVEASNIAREQGYRMRLAMTKCVIGAANAMNGRAPEGVTQISEGIGEFVASGARAHQTVFFALFADALGKVRRFDEGLEAVARGESLAQQTANHWWDAELYRIRGDLIREATARDAEAAEQSYLRSLEIARSQQAKSWELRTANNLAGLWRGVGRQVEAHGLLSPVYNWFTEGFDLPDLKDARTLLAELGLSAPRSRGGFTSWLFRQHK
jgi:class 3 adenylate cyclase/tetratricopeptide (TPR) repeat protein